MPKIKISEAKADMVLDADVKGINDQLLMPKGSVLNEKSIQILEGRGIEDLVIKGEEINVREKFQEKQIQKEEEVLRSMLVGEKLEHPTLNTLIDLLVDRRLNQRLHGIRPMAPEGFDIPRGETAKIRK